MASAPRPLIAGNWKMNGLQRSAAELRRIIEGSGDLVTALDLIVCPPATLVASFAALVKGSALAIGGQDCHAKASGAFTGDISAEMLKDAGASAVILGHSERRTYHRETDRDVRAKAVAAKRAALKAIICIGETQDQRLGGDTLSIVTTQLQESLPDDATPDTVVVAYEPVWAIGTGVTPTPDDVAQVHGLIRQRLTARFGPAGEQIRILYGGSVKPANARELLHIGDVNGALVGGASLQAEDFLAIARASC